MSREPGPVKAVLPDAFMPDWAMLEVVTDEHAFMHAGVELLKEAGAVCLLVAGIIPASPLQRDEAIRCGQLVRMGKLCRLMLADTCDGGGGQQLALSRQMLDATGALIYLCGDVDGGRHQAFVEDSLVAEREMLRDINNRQASEGGEPWLIEERMQRSIGRSAAAGGVPDVSVLPARRVIGWPKSEELLTPLGPTAYTAYRAGSSAIHGNWHDLYRNHLREVAGGFEPNFSVGTPRPQPIFASAVLGVVAAETYLTRRPEQEGAFFNVRLQSLETRTRRADELHELHLERR